MTHTADDDGGEVLCKVAEGALADLLGVEELAGVELPAHGIYHGISWDAHEASLLVWYHDEIRSTHAVPYDELLIAVYMSLNIENGEAVARGSARLKMGKSVFVDEDGEPRLESITGGEITVETSVKVTRRLRGETISHGSEIERVVYSKSVILDPDSPIEGSEEE